MTRSTTKRKGPGTLTSRTELAALSMAAESISALYALWPVGHLEEEP